MPITSEGPIGRAATAQAATAPTASTAPAETNAAQTAPTQATQTVPAAQAAQAAQAVPAEPGEPTHAFRLAQLLARHPELTDASAGSTPQEGASTAPETAAEGTAAAEGADAAGAEPTPAEVRRDYLAASKAKRAADAAAKRAKDATQRADAFERSIGDWRADPKQLLTAAGIDPSEYYRALTMEALKVNAPKDPVREQIDAQVQPYIQALEKAREEIQTEKVRQQEAYVIATQVLPVLNDADRYESILALNNNDPGATARYVYGEVFKHFQETGETVSFDAAADALEAWIENLTDQGIKRSLSTKKFSARYRALGSETDSPGSTKQSERQPSANAKAPAKTLTNNHNASITAGSGRFESTGNPRLDAILSGKRG